MATLTDLRRTSNVVDHAYKFAEAAHKGQRRRTGEPYFNHSIATAERLAAWGLDETTIAAGLLHDVVEDTKATPAEIQKEFGDDIAHLVDGITKLGTVKYRGDKTQADNLRKLILAMAEDLRVILIKLADRLHNMQTLAPLPQEKRERVALETMEIYAPLAYRLGMQGLAGELQDLAFPYAYPDEYKWIIDNVKERYEARVEYLRMLKPVVEQALRDNGVEFLAIDFRAKRYASLYKKLLRNDMDLEKIHDLVAFRIIVKDIESCYGTLGVIHNLWPPLPGKIKDYIATPKPNGYRSLHTTVFGPANKIVEFQIRTEEMHREAETGIAASWAYEDSKVTKAYRRRRAPKANPKEAAWVEQLRSWQRGFADPEEFIDAFKIDFLRDSIFALTPKGEVVDLPIGATPVDFAYHIHSDIGNQCVGAKVNGKIVPLDHKLESSDVVEIITQKSKRPSGSWLDFVVTSNAKAHIRNALKKGGKSRFFNRPEQKIEIKLTVENRPDILSGVSNIISRSHVNIVSLSSAPRERDSYHTIKALCGTDDKDKILKIILKLKTLKGVKEIDYRFV